MSITTYRRNKRRAFTLLEMMLVVVIIGLLVGVAVINLAGQTTAARKGTTEASLSTYQKAITSYYMKNGSYPASLQALVPTEMTSLSKDAWKRDFVYYLTPSDVNGHAYALFSMGEDGQAATQDDISVWNIGQ